MVKKVVKKVLKVRKKSKEGTSKIVAPKQPVQKESLSALDQLNLLGQQFEDSLEEEKREEVELQFSNEGELKVHTKKEQKELLQKRKKAKKERRKERKKLEQTTATDAVEENTRVRKKGQVGSIDLDAVFSGDAKLEIESKPSKQLSAPIQVERVKDTDPTVKTGDSNEEEVENKPSFKDLKSFLSDDVSKQQEGKKEPVNMFRREKPSEEEAKMTQLAKDVEEAGMLNRKRNQAYHRFMEKKEIEMGFLPRKRAAIPLNMYLNEKKKDKRRFDKYENALRHVGLSKKKKVKRRHDREGQSKKGKAFIREGNKIIRR